MKNAESGPGADRPAIAVDGRLPDLTDDERALLLDRRPSGEPELRDRVRSILDRVRDEGDEALREMARRFDGVDLEELEVPRRRWEQALDSLDSDVREALRVAARNIEAFHRAQVPDPLEFEATPGVRLGRRALPVGRAGVYAPGGRAAYPSSVLMGAVPARAAGVREVVVCSPPGPDGVPPAAVLAACLLADADRLFALGGAGAVGALVHGTESVPAVDVVVGPGNRWVTEAKRQVAGEVRIDGPAGPSEVLVVAEDPVAGDGATGNDDAEGRDAGVDDAADADSSDRDVRNRDARAVRIAGELVAQAEHDPEAAVVLVTPSAALLESVRRALDVEVRRTPRREIVEEALASSGALLRADDLDQALAFADEYAPEHLALYTRSPRRDLERIRNAGTVFLGHSASVAFGDYLTGANHVLPTGGRARAFSGLSTEHFLRSFTWQEVTAEAARSLADDVRTLALAEGLPAHARAAELRAREATP